MAFIEVYSGTSTDKEQYWTPMWKTVLFGYVTYTQIPVSGVYIASYLDGGYQQTIYFSAHNAISAPLTWGTPVSGTTDPYFHTIVTDYPDVFAANGPRIGSGDFLEFYLTSYASRESAIKAFAEFVKTLDGNPYAPGGTATTGGGGMSGEPITSDPIDFPSLPDIGAVDAGFVSIWTPTEAQVKNLAHYLWTTDITEGAFWRKLIQNPLELIFGLQILPVPIFHTDESGTPQEGEYIAAKDAVVLGWTKTGIKMDYIVDQYIEIDCGSIDMEEYWHAFLDYEPYTKIDIFLPYIGTKHLDTNDLMPRTLSLKYVIDIASGICVAMLKCDDAVYYQFTGNCASQIPLSVQQMQEIVKGAMSLAVGVGTFVLGGAYGAGEHAAKQAVQTGTAMKAAGAAMVGSGLNSAAKGVNVSRSGTISAAAGLMGVQTPYLIISRPRQAIPENQSSYTGYPSFITEDLSELEGYTEVQMIHLHEMSCTEDEFNEIDKLLAAGVIF